MCDEELLAIGRVLNNESLDILTTGLMCASDVSVVILAAI